jgi:LysM repeat protein
VATDARDRLRRWAAPAALLALVTIAVVLIHNGLSSGSSTPTASTASLPAATATRPRTTRRPAPAATTVAANAQYYVVQSGDTFGSIAARYGTSVAQIETLNPGVSSTSLVVGQKIRVK